MHTNEWKDFALNFVHNWFFVRRSMYFIIIKDILFCNKKRKIMVKYQCVNKRLGDTIPIEEFMSSPLKHATHPDQIFYIGTQTERLSNLINTMDKAHADDFKEELNRFKRIFHSGDH